MPHEKILVPSKLSGRQFYESMGRIEQEPECAVFFDKTIKVKDKFSIALYVSVSLAHGLNGGGDAGRDWFRVRLSAVDSRRCNIALEDRARCSMERSFEYVEDLLHWLLSEDLESSMRAGVVNHPPSPVPSPERDLAQALFGFAHKIKLKVPLLKKDAEIRKNLRSWRGSKESSL